MARRYDPPLTAEAVLRLIKDMPADERDRLARALDCDPCPLGERWAVLPRAIVEMMVEVHAKQCEQDKEALALLSKLDQEWPRNKPHNRDRDAAIRLLVAAHPGLAWKELSRKLVGLSPAWELKPKTMETAHRRSLRTIVRAIERRRERRRSAC